MIALLVAAEVFRVFQYSPRAVTLRGCSECKGEPDDVCEVRAGAQVRGLEEYAQDRWPAEGRLKLLRSRADPDCAVPAKALLGPRGPLELAAVKLGAAPSAELLQRAGPGVSGWPRAPSRRKGAAPSAQKPQRGDLRAAVVCWPSEQGWPAKAHPTKNACEEWLLPVRPDGEPDLAAASFLVGPAEAGTPLDAQPDPAPPAKVEPPPPPAAPVACGEAARSRAATLERFEQWEQQIRGARSSLDRAAFTLNAAAWSGHCQELEVLHAALEQQLGCAVAEQGSCAP